MELKAFGERTFDKEVAKLKASLPERLTKEREYDTTLGGVSLVAAKVEKQGSGWGKVSLGAALFVVGATTWLELKGSLARPSRGKCTGSKPLFATLWSRMRSYTTASGKKVRLLKEFLKELGLDCLRPAGRARTWNEMLRDEGLSDRLWQEKVRNLAGKQPWVAKKNTFRTLYDFV